MEKFSVNLSQMHWARLEQLAVLRDKDTQIVLQEAIDLYAQQFAEAETEESALDMAIRLGLLGMGHGGPPDLSTNPKYMEGFGLDTE